MHDQLPYGSWATKVGHAFQEVLLKFLTVGVGEAGSSLIKARQPDLVRGRPQDCQLVREGV